MRAGATDNIPNMYRDGPGDDVTLPDTSVCRRVDVSSFLQPTVRIKKVMLGTHEGDQAVCSRA